MSALALSSYPIGSAFWLQSKTWRW